MRNQTNQISAQTEKLTEAHNNQALQIAARSVGRGQAVMKYLIRVGQWTAVAAGLFLVSSVTHRLEVDPTADFSFSISNPKGGDNSTFMSENHVAVILSGYLDVFPKSQVNKLARHVMALCKKHKFDPALVLSVIRVESNFHIKARSGVGAMGLMQLMPPTANFVAKRYGIRYTGERSLLDPYTNVALGVAYLSYLREKYREVSPYFQFAAYNMGPARLDQLRLQQGAKFKGTATKDYYESIIRFVPVLRSYPGRAGA